MSVTSTKYLLSIGFQSLHPVVEKNLLTAERTDGGQAELFASKKKNNVLLSILSSEATKEDVIN